MLLALLHWLRPALAFKVRLLPSLLPSRVTLLHQFLRRILLVLLLWPISMLRVLVMLRTVVCMTLLLLRILRLATILLPLTRLLLQMFYLLRIFLLRIPLALALVLL